MTQNTDPELYLQAHNNRANARPSTPASSIDLPVTSYVIPDETTERLVRIEAKMDAQAAQLQWIVSTVMNVVDQLKASPLMSMMSKRMGS